MENKTTMNTQTPQATNTNVRGELTYEDKVIQKIIGIALENIDGLLTVDGGFFSNIKDKIVNSDDVTAGINTEVGKKQVAVDMDIVAEYGKDIEKIYDQMKELIIEEVKKMTHLDVIEVNVNVVDIKSRAEYQDESETVQDKVSNAADSTGKFASRQTDKARNAMESEPRVE
ncbi:Asp23/Gls24 family envelope stress response protein [Enterococcus sp. 669A]|uniref:Stress response regulator gls24 homolog n=1 Tax=Candidatus Enterococcus moelleringii TaxID=2815325 RepID=A0ABS3LGZ4_9ENTE|nr:Asp23/Gls24 family envelope stress response protein [Enterococcus sp. 669A]MBO1307624.1 Asp23/Gls24 family envelope stress response protein [Enterococcus sp. 669A]